MTAQPPVRLAVLDSDTGFLQVLANRLDAAGWQHRVLASPVPVDTLVSMRLNVLVIDLAVLGPAGWSYLEKVCDRLPSLGVIVCTGRSSVSQRVRGLRIGADDWITKPCHPEELIARAEAVARRRRRAEAARAEVGPVVAGELEIRADQFQAFAAGASVDLTRREFELIQLLADAAGPGAAARGDLPAGVGLRDGPRRPLRRRLRPQAAPEARARLAALALHPHALRDRLPLRRRAAGPARGRSGARAADAPSRRPPRCPRWSEAMGPDRNKHIRNVLIIVGLALAVWLLPGGDTASSTVSNLLTVILTAGLLFFAFRLYMEHRATIFGLEDRQRGILYGAVALAGFAIIATSKLWDEGGLGAMLWFGLIGLAVYGMYSVWRTYQEY